jgi:hypothetical protein
MRDETATRLLLKPFHEESVRAMTDFASKVLYFQSQSTSFYMNFIQTDEASVVLPIGEKDAHTTHNVANSSITGDHTGTIYR